MDADVRADAMHSSVAACKVVRPVLARRARLAAARREGARGGARHICRRSSPAAMSSTTRARTVRVPVRMLEHYHFRLRRAERIPGRRPGQGQTRRRLGRAHPEQGQGEKGAGGQREGEIQLMLEFKIDDIVDWLWEEMQLPNLKARVGPSDDSRLDARGLGPARRALAPGSAPLAQGAGQAPGPGRDAETSPMRICASGSSRAAASRRCTPWCSSCWMFPGSMSDRDRKLAKTFFFWVVQGLRREYRSLETVFVAHTTEAWEFNEADFFQVTGSGGTVASTGLNKVREIIDARFNPGAPATSICSTPPTATTGERCRRGAQAALDDIATKACFTRLRGSRLRPVAAARHRDRPPVRASCGRRRQPRASFVDR